MGMRISPKNQNNKTKKINPNLKNLYIKYQASPNSSNNTINNNMNNNNLVDNPNFNNNDNKMNSLNLNDKQQIQYQLNQNTMPSFVNTNNNQLPSQYIYNMGNYPNILQRMNKNPVNQKSPRYKGPMSSHIQNNNIGNMNTNIGIQYNNTTRNNNNIYTNMKLGNGNNQMYLYPNSQNI